MRNNLYYKVVTQENKSLGLRRNPTILTYPFDQWIKSPTIKNGKSDDGGIWVTHLLSNAKRLKLYMKQQYNLGVLIYPCKIGKILYQNSYRTKTDKVYLCRH